MNALRYAQCSKPIDDGQVGSRNRSWSADFPLGPIGGIRDRSCRRIRWSRVVQIHATAVVAAVKRRKAKELRLMLRDGGLCCSQLGKPNRPRANRL